MTRAVDIEGRGVRVNGRSVGVGSAIPDSGMLHDYNALKLNLNDGDTVSTWTDQEGTANASATGGPTYTTSGINGNASVVYDGNDDGHDATGYNILDDTVVFLVTEPNNNGNIQEPLQSKGNNEETVLWRFDQTGDEYRIGWDGGFTEAGTVSQSPEIQTYVWNQTNGNIQIRSNGTSIYNASETLNSISIDGFSIGYRETVGDRFIAASIGRLLVYNLTDLRQSNTISDVESGLADEWDITI